MYRTKFSSVFSRFEYRLFLRASRRRVIKKKGSFLMIEGNPFSALVSFSVSVSHFFHCPSLFSAFPFLEDEKRSSSSRPPFLSCLLSPLQCLVVSEESADLEVMRERVPINSIHAFTWAGKTNQRESGGGGRNRTNRVRGTGRGTATGRKGARVSELLEKEGESR